ncbi:carboxylesterase family protein [Terrabacter sp. BE26]|uniref:carboxylesterase family protein n=1 Tax=Terrabacter sp. BE26 TaxID=2898152 RepID=UPI0035BE2F25
MAVFTPDPQRYRDAFPDPEELYDVVRSDWLFRMPSLKLAEAQHAAGAASGLRTAHLYELTWEAPRMGGALGACHGLDVPLVFGNLTVGQTALLIGGPSPEATIVSRQMGEAWTAFAARGDPGWPHFDPHPDSETTRIFDVQPRVTAYPEKVSRAIWSDDPGVIDLA